MIDYAKVQRGDILRLLKPTPPPSFGTTGDLVRVTQVTRNGVMTENRDGERCEFVFNCGAAYLEPTEWRDDFPAPAVCMGVDLGSDDRTEHFESPIGN